jgi:glucose/arabinose dehydrogenase
MQARVGIHPSRRAAPFESILAMLAAVCSVLLVGATLLTAPPTLAQEGPALVDRNLVVASHAAGLELPTTMAFLGPDDLLVLEKNSGKVKRVVGGGVQSTVLDLSVNNFSERGLLGIALHPDFPADPGVYLFWTCRSVAAPDADPFRPEETRCSDSAMTGLDDSDDVLQVPLLGNRVDRFEWANGALTYDHNLEMLLAFQNDGAPEPPGQGDDENGPNGQQPARGNHDGGIIAFGSDEKLFVMVGDLGRRGALQNLPCGPTATQCDGPEDVTPDDQFGGPAPDDAHFSGVILRLNDDGTTPSDNPFFAAGAAMGGEVGANIQRTFAYGIRNSFGMAVDPLSGRLWQQENGEDAFDELNRVEAGMNSGWIQVAGPSTRVAQYREIETTSLHHDDFPNLQQFRWDPQNIAATPAAALERLFRLPGSTYSEPEFSWKFVLAPSAIGFQDGRALGPQYAGDLVVGFSTTDTLGGPLFRFNLTGNRRAIAVDDPRLADRVADNLTFHEMTESESLIFGTDFGIATDIETGPNGNLFVVSLDHGAIYEISRR